ncbi:MAG: VOC family protein [Flavobacteriales bacterium]|nr:VOC family protein [Flavobacteriales bacterium]
MRSTEEVDALFAELKKHGVTITKEPVKVFWGGYSGYFADPDGHLWEIAHNPFLEMDAAGNVTGMKQGRSCRASTTSTKAIPRTTWSMALWRWLWPV